MKDPSKDREYEPLEAVISVMGKRILGMWVKISIDENGKLNVKFDASRSVANRREFALVLINIANAALNDDWKDFHDASGGCQSCFDHLSKHEVLPIVCTDCGRGVLEYEKETGDR